MNEEQPDRDSKPLKTMDEHRSEALADDLRTVADGIEDKGDLNELSPATIAKALRLIANYHAGEWDTHRQDIQVGDE